MNKVFHWLIYYIKCGVNILYSYINNYNFIEQVERNVILSQLLEISKNINSSYNDYINNEIENSEDSENSENIDNKQLINAFEANNYPCNPGYIITSPFWLL